MPIELTVILVLLVVLFGYFYTRENVRRLNKRIDDHFEEKRRNPRNPYQELAELLDERDREGKDDKSA